MITELPRAKTGKPAGVVTAIKTPETAVAFKRVHYSAVPPTTVHVLLKFKEPQQCVAFLEDIKTIEWDTPASVSSDTPSPDFDCICLSAQTPELIQRAEKWIDHDGELSACPSVRVNFNAGWVRLKPGRVVLCAPREQWEGLLAALADFTLYEFELRKLEHEIAADWGRAETDLPLAGDVRSEDLKRQGNVSAMTQLVFTRRIRLSKLERSLIKTQAVLPRYARRLAARLRTKLDVESRNETLDGQIEVYEYVYEMANQRMGEYRNFRREYVLEILIVLLLAGELALMMWEHFAPGDEEKDSVPAMTAKEKKEGRETVPGQSTKKEKRQ